REHEERRPLRTRRNHEERLLIASRERLTAGAADADALPFAYRQGARAIGMQVVKAPRNHHLVTPGLAGHPAVLLEVVRRRGDQVGNRIDHVATAVAVEIDRVALERCRHELRRAECAGPGTLELLGPQIATRNDLQR